LATKAELLAALAADVYTVGTPTSVTDAGATAAGFNKYNVEFYDDIGNDVMRRRNADFLVADEGGGGEEAFWVGGSPVVITNFGDTVRASSQYQDAHASIENEGPDWARVYGYVDNEDTTMTKTWWILEDDGASGINVYTVTNPDV